VGRRTLQRSNPKGATGEGPASASLDLQASFKGQDPGAAAGLAVEVAIPASEVRETAGGPVAMGTSRHLEGSEGFEGETPRAR